MRTKNSGGFLIEKSISKEKAITWHRKNEVRTIFIEDQEGTKRAGFKSIEAAEAVSSKVFVATPRGLFQVQL
jgi:hypothetical protein